MPLPWLSEDFNQLEETERTTVMQVYRPLPLRHEHEGAQQAPALQLRQLSVRGRDS